MAYDNDQGRELSWDDPIEHDSSFELLEEGDYDFRVVKFERARHAGSAKLPPCNKAILTLEVTDDDGKRGQIIHNLFLHTKTEGMVCAFFTAIGQRKHGEALIPKWQETTGSTGRCHVYVDVWTKNDGSEGKSNKIDKFYEPTATNSTQSKPPEKPAYTPPKTYQKGMF